MSLVDPLGRVADTKHRIFPLVGEAVIHSHNAMHQQWQLEPDKRTGACAFYEERDFSIVHTIIVAEMRRRGLAHSYTDDLDHKLPLYLKKASTGYEGEITSDYIYDTCGEIVATTAEDAKGLIDKIPTAKGVNLKEITDGDDTPFFVVVRAMRVGMSGNRRKYSKEIVEKFRNLHPMPGYESHQHIDRPEYGRHPPMFHQVTAWVGALIIDDELFSKGYVPAGEEKLRRDIRLAHAMSKGMVVSITGKVEQILKKDDDGEYWDVLDIWEGSIDFYQPTATPGISGAGSVGYRKGKQKSTSKQS